LAAKFSFGAVPEREDDLLCICRVDLIGRQTPYESDRGPDTRLEFGDVRLSLRKCRRVHAREQTTTDNRMPDGLSDLAGHVVHVGVEPRIEQNRGIDFSRFGVSRRLVEKTGQTA